MAALVSTYGGRPVAAPALREIPLESNPEALALADALKRGAFDIVILLTGVGTRVLLDVVQATSSRDEFVAALARTKVVPRGPKPLAVLRELKITPWITVPEPNTWRELLTALDEKAGSLRGQRIAVQEYGKPNDELLRALEARGASVTSVPVYRWALPDDIEPLRGAVSAIVRGELDVALFTTSVQIVHLMQVADSMGQSNAIRRRLYWTDLHRRAAESGNRSGSRSLAPEDGISRARSRRAQSRPAPLEKTYAVKRRVHL
jgi:uroporphyrinogen-III synthase